MFSLRVRVAGEDASTQLASAQAPGIVHQNSSSSLNALVSTNTGTNTNSSLYFMRGMPFVPRPLLFLFCVVYAGNNTY